MRKIKLCRLIFEFLPGSEGGGSVTHTIELAKYIHPHCEKQFLLVPKAEGDTSELDQGFDFEANRINYCQFKFLHRLKMRCMKWLPLAPLVVFSYGLFAIPRILQLNRRYGIDIIHAHGISTGVIATIAARLLRKPVVWTLDGTLTSYSAFSGMYETIVIKLFRPDRTLVVDNGGPAAERFRKLLNNEKLTLVFININPEKVYPKPVNADLLDRLNLKNKFVFISVHSLSPVQGVENAILGFKEFMQLGNVHDATLLIIGDGSLREQLEQLTSNLGLSDMVLFLGRIDNSQIPDYHSISDVALSTSTKVNMNTSTEEAMACAKPVIAFDCGNTADKLIRHMETGLLVESGNVRDLAVKMLMLYQSPELRRKIGENARQFIIQNRSWENRIEKELGVYENLLQGKQGRKSE